MKITSKLVALAVSCVGIPATVLAHDADIIGPWELTIKVQNKTFSAISTCDKAHRVLEMDYAPPSIFGPSRAVEVGYGSWREENGHILLSYETALPHHMTRVVRGTATLTEPNVITGNVEVKILEEDGKVVYTDTASVTGTKASRNLAANR